MGLGKIGGREIMRPAQQKTNFLCNKHEKLLFIILRLFFIALGAFLIIYRAWVPNFWLDEYGTSWVASAGGGLWAMAKRAATVQPQSPFYYSFAWLSFKLFGPGQLALRLPSWLFGIGVLCLSYPLAYQLFAERIVALFALAYFAIHPDIIRYSQEARPYSLAMFFTMLTYLYYLKFTQQERPAFRLSYIFSSAAVFYSHFIFSLCLVPLVLHALFIHARSWSARFQWLRTFVILGLACVPGLLQLAYLTQRRMTLDWVPPNTNFFAPFDLAANFMQPKFFVLLALLVLGLSKSKAAGGPALRFLCLLFIVPIVLNVFLRPLLSVNVLIARYLLYTILPAILITAWLSSFLAESKWYRWLPLCFLLFYFSGTVLYPTYQQNNMFSNLSGPGWPQAISHLEHFAKEHDVVFYRTGFVEADQLDLPNPENMQTSFIKSPITANCQKQHDWRLAGLPYRLNNKTLPYLTKLIELASRSQRVWLIGQGDLIFWMKNKLKEGQKLTVRQSIEFNHIMVLLLEKTEAPDSLISNSQ